MERLPWNAETGIARVKRIESMKEVALGGPKAVSVWEGEPQYRAAAG